jgi:hypothetical protein
MDVANAAIASEPRGAARFTISEPGIYRATALGAGVSWSLGSKTHTVRDDEQGRSHMANQVKIPAERVFFGTRIPVETKRALALVAKANGSSIQSEVTTALERHVERVREPVASA